MNGGAGQRFSLRSDVTWADLFLPVLSLGPGMTQEQLQSVFTRQAFGGAPDENSMQQGSTGLGLSLVKALVESHKGTVYARSQPWKETVVGVSLPIYRTTKIDLLSENRMGSSEASDLVSVVDGFSPFKTAGMKSKVVGQEFCTHSPSNNEVTSCEGFVPVHPNKIEILSVDDDHMNHLVLGNMLTPKNYAVLKALSGEQALALLNQRFETGGLQALPPIILMDVMMPDMDGYETVLRIRRTFPTADISIIMISAKATEESIHRGFQSGCNDYIIKPVKVSAALPLCHTSLSLHPA